MTGWLARTALAALLLFPLGALALPPQMLLPAMAEGRLRLAELELREEAAPVRFNAAAMFGLKRLEVADFRMPSGATHPYVFELAQDHGEGIRSWIGQHKERGNSYRAVITTGPAGSFGSITTPEGEFRLVPGEGHDWLVDMSRLPEPVVEMGDDFKFPPAQAKSAQPLATPSEFEAIPGVNVAGIYKAAPTPNVYVDILVLYTQGYLSFFGSSTSMLTRINNLVTRANAAYVDSEVAITLRLAGTQLVNYSDGPGGTAGQTTSSYALNALSPPCVSGCTNSFDATAFGGIEALRTATGADVVTLLRDGNQFSTDGIAWIGWNHNVNPPAPLSQYMYSVTTGCPALCDMVFIHEIGHNMGNMHDRNTTSWQYVQNHADANYGFGAYSYGYGFAYCESGFISCDPTRTAANGGCSSQPECAVADDTRNFSDLMAYFHGSTYRNYKFSNPNVICVTRTGVQHLCGIFEASVGNSANTALAMNNTRQALSAVTTAVIGALTSTNTTLTSSINPSIAAQSITLTAHVTSASATPAGTVAFKDGTTTIGGCGAVALSLGVANCTTSSLATGTRSLTAVYSGNSTFATSTSTALSQVVNAAPPVQLLSATSIDFGGNSIQTTAPAKTATVTNISGGTVTPLSVAASADYAVVSTTCLGALAPGGTCQVVVSFTPTSVGTVAGQVAVNYSGGGPTLVNVTGIGERSLTTHYYRAILNRDPDAAGKAFWESEAARLESLGADLREAYYVMAGYFFNSPEYLSYNKNDAQFVSDLYNTFFNRGPDLGGLNYWVSQIQGGLPREVVLFSFMFSPEFQTFSTTVFGSVAARPEVNIVMDFFRGVLNRLPDTAAFNFWVGQLKTAQCRGAGAVYTAVDNISYTFIFGAEYTNRNRNNTQYVTDLYYSFLRRGGDTPGVSYWVDQLTRNLKDRNTERGDFIASPEFGARVTSTIQAGCAP